MPRFWRASLPRYRPTFVGTLLSPASLCLVALVALACWLLFARQMLDLLTPIPAPGLFDLRDEQGRSLPQQGVQGAVDPAAEYQGWAGPAAVEAMQNWSAAVPVFRLRSAETGLPVWQDNTRANVRLWLLARRLSAEYPEPGYQETGDCTSWGAGHAIGCTQASQITLGQPSQWQRPYQPWLYGAGRVWVWQQQDGVRRLPSAGCSGAAVARAAQQFGVLPYDTPGLPPYTGRVADEWGRRGPPENLKEIAARHKVQTIARITTLAEARDALANGYGISIASDWGNPRKRYQRVDGRWVGERTGVWSHQMCLDGYDGSAEQGPFWHITNSWPKSSHPAPIDDSPPGGFWVRDRDIQYILDANDSFAFSDFSGFPARDLDWSPILPRTP